MTELYANLACGGVYISSSKWLNLDFSATGPDVRQANLLAALPLADESVELVYSSHFLEHIPVVRVPGFLAECYRILKPSGTLRLVVPDLENLCREYLFKRDEGKHTHADFVVLEMIDQCVRQVPGGALGRFYQELGHAEGGDADTLIDYVRERTGEDLRFNRTPQGILPRMDRHPVQLFRGVLRWVQRLWIRLWLQGLPNAFVEQNVSLVAVGERHHWLWDFHQLRSALKRAGFAGCARWSYDSSGFSGFPCDPLDVDADGLPRKGAESMYVEARRPNWRGG